ncbi:hypothetical protein [Arthrobacter sp. CAN_C5]|nr:hypothetical protein [Arthrobacter sp. CAN_C5]MBP2217050.1 hypothetical protein [Arthrobacter sp. CAN_C5]
MLDHKRQQRQPAIVDEPNRSPRNIITAEDFTAPATVPARSLIK